MPAKRFYPSEKQVQIGSTMLPAYEERNAKGEYTGELVVSSAHRQPLKGAKCHGGHCAMCGVELDPMTNESSRGVCDECAKDDKRWAE